MTSCGWGTVSCCPLHARASTRAPGCELGCERVCCESSLEAGHFEQCFCVECCHSTKLRSTPFNTFFSLSRLVVFGHLSLIHYNHVMHQQKHCRSFAGLAIGQRGHQVDIVFVPDGRGSCGSHGWSSYLGHPRLSKRSATGGATLRDFKEVQP